MSTENGLVAESLASSYLTRQGFVVRERNWKTRWCEIDIVAEKEKRLYFVEVKFRRNPNFGTGVDYITQDKVRRMARASTMWVTSHDWQGGYCLAAIGVSGTPPNVDSFFVLE